MGGVLEGDIPAGKRCSCAIVLFVAADAVHLLVGEVDVGDIDSRQSLAMESCRIGLGPDGLRDLADGIGIIFQVADPPEAIAVSGRIPFLGGIVDFDPPAR